MTDHENDHEIRLRSLSASDEVGARPGLARIVKKREHITKPRNTPYFATSTDDGYMGHFWIYTKSIYAVPFL